jgi:23S rRNA pseudouridine1911/1915/1917 synthase
MFMLFVLVVASSAPGVDGFPGSSIGIDSKTFSRAPQSPLHSSPPSKRQGNSNAKTVAQLDPLTLLDYVMLKFDGATRKSAKQWLSASSLFINGVPSKQFDHPLVVGDVVSKGSASAYGGSSVLTTTSATAIVATIAPAVGAAPAPAPAAGGGGMRIIFEDEHLIVVDKPIGLLTVATDGPKGKGDKVR